MKALADAVAPVAWHGLWPGRVVSDRDPTADGLVQVRVDQVYGDPNAEDEYIADDDLPWARVLTTGGPGTGQEWTPPVGTAVIVGFWAGDPERPFVLGGYHPPAAAPDHRIPEHVSSYDNGPKTRIIRTEGDQVFEMRWKAGEEKIRLRTAAGCEILLEDAPAEQGIFIDVRTPGGYHLRLDEKERFAVIETPGGRMMRLDDAAQSAQLTTPTQTVTLLDAVPAVNVTTPGAVNVTAGGVANVTATGALNMAGSQITQASTAPGGTATTTAAGLSTSTFTGAAIRNFLGALTLSVAGVFAATFAGIATLNAVGILTLFGSAVVLGTVLGAKFRLADERFFAVYNAHTHVDSMAGPTTAPVMASQIGPTPPQVPIASVATTDVTAS